MMSLQDELSHAVRCELEDQDLAQANLASLARFSDKHVSRMLTGKACRAEGWDRLFAALGVRPRVTLEPIDPDEASGGAERTARRTTR
jgi:hypothetical protein